MKIGKTVIKDSDVVKGKSKKFTPQEAKRLAKTFNGMVDKKPKKK